jgi:hypothetical protein
VAGLVTGWLRPDAPAAVLPPMKWPMLEMLMWDFRFECVSAPLRANVLCSVVSVGTLATPYKPVKLN